MQFTKKDTLLVKGAAILMMLLHHCFESASRYAGYEINFFPLTEAQTITVASFFKICVAVFVFLSGFGIAKSLEKIEPKKAGDYARQVRRRSFSLMSGFWIIFILCIISAAVIDPSMLSVYSGGTISNTAFNVLFDFLGLAELFGTPTLIGTWWYMSLALIIICIMPPLYKFYKKFGIIPVFVLTFLVTNIVKTAAKDDILNYDMIRYLFTLELGMLCADKNVLPKIKEFRFVKKSRAVDYVIKLALYSAVMVWCVYIRRYLDWRISYIRDGLIPFLVIIYCYTVIAEIPGIRQALQFLGKHSMNIFMSHTILRAYFLKDFIYGMKYSWAVFLVLLALSIALSIVIDLIKKYTGYNKLCDKIQLKLIGAKGAAK
ncbi:MAG: acyltransferase [Clostridia bacterium]|nr:acyltransferase [Clostridia bacterium]